MPKKNESYSCLISGRQHSSYEKAEACEKMHKVPVAVDKPEYDVRDKKSNYPLSVLVHFSDNSSARYFRR